MMCLEKDSYVVSCSSQEVALSLLDVWQQAQYGDTPEEQ